MRGVNKRQGGKKKTIVRYISLRFFGITAVTAILMTLFIAYFSDIATEFDIKAQVRRESRYDHLNVDCKDAENPCLQSVYL